MVKNKPARFCFFDFIPEQLALLPRVINNPMVLSPLPVILVDISHLAFFSSASALATDISHLSSLKPLSYPGEPPDPSETAYLALLLPIEPPSRHAETPIRPLPPSTPRSSGVSAQHQPLPPPIANLSPGRRVSHAAPTAGERRTAGCGPGSRRTTPAEPPPRPSGRSRTVSGSQPSHRS